MPAASVCVTSCPSLEAVSGCRVVRRQIRSADGRLCKFQKAQWGSRRQGASLLCQALEQTQSVEARCVKVVMNILRQIAGDIAFRQTQARRPFSRDLAHIAGEQSIIPRLLE